VFTSGHTLSHRADKDQVFILVDRHHSADKKEAAVVVAHRDTGEMDLALLHVPAGECIPAQIENRPSRTADMGRRLPVGTQHSPRRRDREPGQT